MALSVSNVDLAVLPPAHDVVFLTIVCTFAICRASHVTKSSRYLSAKIIIFSDLELSVCALSSSQNKYRQFKVKGCSNFVFSILVTIVYRDSLFDQESPVS